MKKGFIYITHIIHGGVTGCAMHGYSILKEVR